MPTDVRELLERGAPMPSRDVDVDAVSTRGRQWRRRRSATAAAAVVAVVALAVLPLPRLLTPPTDVVFDQPPNAALVGTWVSTDNDGTSRTMNIRALDADRYSVGLHYEAASECGGTAATVAGTGQVDTAGLVIAMPSLTCDDGSTPVPVEGSSLQDALRGYTLGYDAETATFTDSFGVQWGRQGDRVSADPLEPALAYGIDGDIYVADWNGTNPVRIADGVPVNGSSECGHGEYRAEYEAFGSAWSPDGRYLAYWDWRPCPAPPNEWGTVIISDPEGNVVASFPGQGWLISWSPDSTRVAVFDTIWEGETTIGVYGLDGVQRAALAVPASLMPSGDVSPVWARDGSALLIKDVQVPLDGRAPRKLPDDVPRHSYPAYSPDGTLVAYKNASKNRESLVVADAAGSDARKVGSATEYREAAWSPSGDRVAFIHVEFSDAVDSEGFPLVLSSELRVREVATGAETSLVNASRSEGLGVIEFSPDGNQILFSRGGGNGGSLWSVNAGGSEPLRLVPSVEWADWRP